MESKPVGATASGSTVAEMLKPKRTRAEKAALKKQNLVHAEILQKETPEYREKVQDPQSEKEPDYLELGLILDATKSMKPWINIAKETLSEVIDSCVKESEEDGENPLLVRVCFIGFRDHKDDERFSICPFTEDIQQVKDFMNNCIAEGGKDIPEDVVGGLKMCLMQDWTNDSIKKVFIIGDAPCHGKKFSGDLDDHFPDGSPEGLKIEDLMKEYCKLDIDFSIIKLNTSVNAMIETMRDNHQELDVKDMSDQAVDKQISDHILKVDPSKIVDPSDKFNPKLLSGGGYTPGFGAATMARGAAVEECAMKSSGTRKLNTRGMLNVKGLDASADDEDESEPSAFKLNSKGSMMMPKSSAPKKGGGIFGGLFGSSAGPVNGAPSTVFAPGSGPSMPPTSSSGLFGSISAPKEEAMDMLMEMDSAPSLMMSNDARDEIRGEMRKQAFQDYAISQNKQAISKYRAKKRK